MRLRYAVSVTACAAMASLALTAAGTASATPRVACSENVHIKVTVPRHSAQSNGPRETATLAYSPASCGHPVRALIRCVYRASHGGPAVKQYFHGKPNIRRPADGKSRARCRSSVSLVDADWAGYEFLDAHRHWHKVKLLPRARATSHHEYDHGRQGTLPRRPS